MSPAAQAKIRDYATGVLLVAAVVGMWSMARDLSSIESLVRSIDKRVERLEDKWDLHTDGHPNGGSD